jgi:hypothetical protein
MNTISQKVEMVEKNIPRSKGGTRKNQKKIQIQRQRQSKRLH